MKKMTGLERMEKVINLEEPDIVPHSELVSEKVREAILPDTATAWLVIRSSAKRPIPQKSRVTIHIRSSGRQNNSVTRQAVPVESTLRQGDPSGLGQS